MNIRLTDYSPVDEESISICKELQEKIDSGETQILNIYGNEETNPAIFHYFGGKYFTKNYVGVINTKLTTSDGSRENVTLSIQSRFDKTDEQNFLNYVFAKAFDLSGRIFKNMPIPADNSNRFDALLAMAFVVQLNAAIKKGGFRQYKKYELNDSRLKGTLDVPRHIRLNPLDNGKVAYINRSYTTENFIICLILQALDKLYYRFPSLIDALLISDRKLWNEITLLKDSFQGYERVQRRELFQKTFGKITNPVYSNYEALRKTSIVILKSLGQNIYSSGPDSSVGVLISMDKLWEKFLYNTVFRYLGKDAAGDYTQEKYEILEGKRRVQPDFLFKGMAVFDAKYKASWDGTVSSHEWSDGVRDDVFQVISYMSIFELQNGGVVFPYANRIFSDKGRIYRYKLFENSDKYFYSIPYCIFKSSNDFYEQMERYNEQLVHEIDKLIFSQGTDIR